MFAGIIGFGRLYSATAVSFIGLIFIVFEGRIFHGLVEWIEKLLFISSVLNLIGEYLYIAIRH